MSEPIDPADPYGPRYVNLHARITVRDKTVQAYWSIPLWQWEQGGEEFQAYAKQDVRRRLAEEIVRQLDPEVVVEMPQPTFAEALNEVMAEVDAANSAY